MIARSAYGLLFVLLLPLLLAAWASRLTALMPELRTPHEGAGWAGLGLLAAGLLLMAWAMLALWREGRGLPMNAFPPPKLVEGGPYALVAHPIYVGFSLACFGTALLARSPGGLWIVAPSATLAALSLGAGHETPDLRRRFGRTPRTLAGRLAQPIRRASESPSRPLLALAERVANSWREWRLGPVRFINHGLYAGLAAAVGVGIVGTLIGPVRLLDIVLLSLASLLGAALWGQYWVGSKSLLRPFGYFGSVLAILIVVPLLSLLGRTPDELWALAAAAAVAAPWVQAIGRLRCLVQGCCHGAPLEPASAGCAGIVYRHPRSRVCWVSHLEGVRLHPTPLYSMGFNLLIGVALAVLWRQSAPASFILGSYLFLTGCARFVEESRRGEVTTPVRGGLRLYQWFAVCSAVLGAATTCLHSTAAPSTARFSWAVLAAAVGVGVVHFLAMGVDFPESNRRFARLA